MFLDATAQLWFALCMWQFLQLTLSYFGGESRFVRKMEGTMLPWKGPPCCCWPCCVCCPKSTVIKYVVQPILLETQQNRFAFLMKFTVVPSTEYDEILMSISMHFSY